MSELNYGLQELEPVRIDNTPAAKDDTAVVSREDDITPANNDNQVSSEDNPAPPVIRGSPSGGGFPRPVLPELSMVGLWTLCVVVLALHILAVLRWPKEIMKLGYFAKPWIAVRVERPL